MRDNQEIDKMNDRLDAGFIDASKLHMMEANYLGHRIVANKAMRI
jgi:hypothetical protein